MNNTLDCIKESFYFQLNEKKLNCYSTFWLSAQKKQFTKIFDRLVRMKYKKDIEGFKPKKTTFEIFKHHSDNILKDQVTIKICYTYNDYLERDHVFSNYKEKLSYDKLLKDNGIKH